jgi:hypothetical protein
MINKENIVAFIQFLYVKKNGVQAPQNLLDKWQDIPEHEILTQLDFLYDSWNYNLVQRGAIVQEFSESQKTIRHDMRTITSNASVNDVNTRSIQNKTITTPTATDALAPKKNILTKLLGTLALISALISALYIGYKYYHFTHLHNIYTLTERVAIRAENGTQVGTLDLNATGTTDSYQELTAYDKAIYNRPIDSSSKLFEHRKVVMQKDNFIDFLQNKPEIFAYVNAKYVVDSKEEYETYKRIFGQLNTDDNKRLQLKHRQIVANCMKRSSALKNLYAVSACSNASKQVRKNYAGIITHELIAENKYEILLRLSDGYYYLLTGDVVSNAYDVPRRIGYVANPNRADEYLSGDLLFKYNNKTKQFSLANCNGKPMPYHSVTDASGALQFFEKDLPTESPLQPLEEFTETAQDAIENVKDAVEEIFN